MSVPKKIIDIEECRPAIAEGVQPFFRGHVDVVSGMLVEATGLPAAIGEVCRIDRARGGSIDAEVVGFRGSSTLLMPHGDVAGIAPDSHVVPTGQSFLAPVGEHLLGRVIDGLGRPIDQGPRLPRRALRSVHADSPEPLSRPPIREPLQTGVRSIDAMTTLGRGQRVGIFAGSGVGKSSLLGQITRGTDADVTIVALVGERGREVRSFVDETLGPDGLRNAILVVATSDRPPIERYLAPFVAVTIAEFFRDQGANALLVMDSVTRFAAACREIGLAAGEPPTVRGYPPSFFATVPKLVERLGATRSGSITGILTILLEGDDPNEPVADTLRGLLDGHILLDRDLAVQGHYPPVNVLASLSRLMPDLVDADHQRYANRLREMLAAYRDGRDLVEIGAYKPGSNQRLDEALRLKPALDVFLRQSVHDLTAKEDTYAMLKLLYERAAEADHAAG